MWLRVACDSITGLVLTCKQKNNVVPVFLSFRTAKRPESERNRFGQRGGACCRVAGNGHRAGLATGQIPTAGSGAQSAVLLGRAGVGREHDSHGRAAWHLHAGGKQGGGPEGFHCRANWI